MAKDKDKPAVDDPHRQIIPTAEDTDMLIWLEDLFRLSPRTVEPGTPKAEPDSFPERVTLRAVSGIGGRDMGAPLKNEEWKPMQAPLPSRESLIALANKMRSAAQKETNTLGRQQRYGLFAFSNLKGAQPYERYLFVLAPTGREYTAERPAPAADDEDTHRDRLLSSALAHSRWQQEQFSEAISGVMSLQQSIITQQAATIAQQNAERREMIVAVEEALSKKQERELKARWADVGIAAVGEGLAMAKGLLPSLVAAMTKDPTGIVLGLKNLLTSFSVEQFAAVMGTVTDEGQVTAPGILGVEESQLVIDVMMGRGDPRTLGRLNSMIQPHQILAVQGILSGAQLTSLASLLSVSAKMGNQANGAAAQT